MVKNSNIKTENDNFYSHKINACEGHLKNAIVCYRPYQLFSYINMAVHNIEGLAENTDLYLMNLPDLMKIKDSICESGLFSNVYIFRDLDKAGSIIRKINKVIDFSNPKKAIKKYMLSDEEIVFDEYEKIFSTGWAYFFVFLSQINKGAQIIMADDGTASLLGDFRDTEVTKRMEIFTKITGWGPSNINISKLYLNNLDLLVRETDFQVYELPTLDEQTKTALNRVFDYKLNSTYEGRKLIFLSEDLYYDRRKELKCIEELCKSYIDRMIVRRHPAEKEQSDYFDDFYFDEYNQIWEILSGDVVNNDTVLMSFFSTAQLTPWIFYGKTPTLIFLYNLVNIPDVGQGVLEKKVLDVYPGKILIPKTMDELRAGLIEVMDC